MNKKQGYCIVKNNRRKNKNSKKTNENTIRMGTGYN